MALAGKVILGIYVLCSNGAIAGVGIVNTNCIVAVVILIVIGDVLGIGRVVILVVLLAVQVSTGVNDIYISDATIQGQTGLVPVIIASSWPESTGFKVAKELRIMLDESPRPAASRSRARSISASGILRERFQAHVDGLHRIEKRPRQIDAPSDDSPRFTGHGFPLDDADPSALMRIVRSADIPVRKRGRGGQECPHYNSVCQAWTSCSQTWSRRTGMSALQ